MAHGKVQSKTAASVLLVVVPTPTDKQQSIQNLKFRFHLPHHVVEDAILSSGKRPNFGCDVLIEVSGLDLTDYASFRSFF